MRAISKHLALMLIVLLPTASMEAQDGELGFDDRPLEEAIILPDWFRLSFLELHDDLTEATNDGKRGLIIYFGQKKCAYCKAHLERNWGRPDILAYTQKHFDVVAINVQGDRLVTDLEGAVRTEKQFSVHMKTQFTPSFLFIDRDGKVALRLAGYHPPYEFQAALEFVADEHYREEPFRDYLARAESIQGLAGDALNEHEIFARPPFALDRSRFAADAPLAVFFERRQCHACDVLHAEQLANRDIVQALRTMSPVQLDMQSDVPVIVPDGTRHTARSWSEELELFYAPTLMFFDRNGREIIRVDSVVGFFRLRNVLQFVQTGGYREQPNYQLWREQNVRTEARSRAPAKAAPGGPRP